jgi:hypothetical protein
LGRFVGVTKSFAGGSPSKGGNDGSAHIFVQAAQRHDLSVFDPMSAKVKIEPDDNMTGAWDDPVRNR